MRVNLHFSCFVMDIENILFFMFDTEDLSFRNKVLFWIEREEFIDKMYNKASKTAGKM